MYDYRYPKRPQGEAIPVCEGGMKLRQARPWAKAMNYISEAH